MSQTKRFLQRVSETMGYSGDINDKVIKYASEILSEGVDSIQSITKLHHELKKEHKNETQSSDSIMAGGDTS